MFQPQLQLQSGAVVSTTSPSWAAGWAQQPSAVQPQGLPPRSWGCCHQGKGKCQSCWVLRSQPTAPCWWSLATGQCYLGKEGATRTPPTRSQQQSTYSCACTKSYLAGSRAQIWLGNTTDKRRDGAGHGQGSYFFSCFCCWYLLKWVWMVTAAFSEGSLKNLPSLLASGVTLPGMRTEHQGELRRCWWPQTPPAPTNRARPRLPEAARSHDSASSWRAEGDGAGKQSPASLAALSPLFTQLYSLKTSASPRLITTYDTHLLSHAQIRLEKKPGTVRQ